MKTLFVVGVEALLVAEDLGKGDRFGDSFRITNDKAVVRDFLPSCFEPTAGSLETHYLLSGEPVIYAIEEFSPANDAEAMRHLTLRLRQVNYFLHLLWYEKDNAAHTEMGYLVTGLNGPTPVVHRNSFGGLRTTSLGQLVTVSFSREELRSVRQHFEMLTSSQEELRNARPHFDMPTPLSQEESSQVLVESVGRWGRADYFVQAARVLGDLGVKLANYCTALEALFSTDNMELSHKLAERVAVFLEADSAGRQELYKSMKSAYSIRSKVVHGARGSTKLLEKARQAATTCDDVCRRALLKILTEENLHDQFSDGIADDAIEEFFLKRILGE